MSSTAFANIRGVPSIASITEINVRSGASTSFDIVQKVPVGTEGLSILAVEPDVDGGNLDGKRYQWFQLQLNATTTGWVRDDLLAVYGDLTSFGYSNLADPTFAFALNRSDVGVATPTVQPAPATEPTPAVVTEETPVTTDVTPPTTEPPPATSPYLDALQDTDRVREVSFAITAAFEGTGYAAYNNYDAGIISYGLIQFTLAAGSLATVVNTYLATSQSDTANQLRGYQERINARDSMLRNDNNLRSILIAAANEPEMQAAQDQVATDGYWKSVVDGYITHRGLRLPLTWALLFDMGVNFGVNHGFVRLAEKQLGVPSRSKPGENGITEEQLMTRVAVLRKASHDRQAERDNLPGLRVRGDFWMDLVNNGNWYLQGESVNVNGRIISLQNA